MAVTAAKYNALADHLAQKRIDFDSDAIKCMLLSAYTPDVDNHVYLADPLLAVGTETTGTGYTAGGATLTSVTFSKAAGTRANSTAYSVGQIATPGNGHWYMVTTAGTTGGSTPTWPTTDGGTVTDGTAVWTEQGRGNVVWQLKGTIPAWNAAGGALTARYAIFYDGTPSTNATRPLICYWNLNGGADQTATDASFTLTQGPAGILVVT